MGGAAARRSSRVRWLGLAMVVLLAGAGSRVLAQQEETASRLRGHVEFGVRAVDVNGVEGRYRQHVNLDGGPRLFGLGLDYEPGGRLGDAVDRLSLDLSNFGGDPFQSLRFDLRKYGRYSLQYRHVESVYFHEDILFAGDVEDPGIHLEGDFTAFDLTRVRDVLRFGLNLGSAAKLDLGLNRYTRKGDSQTKLRLARVVTPLARPVDETLNDVDIGFEYRWARAAVVFQERIRRFDNATELFLPGASDRSASTTILSFFRAQPYDLGSAQHTVRLNLTPTPRWLLRASVSVENMGLDGTTDEALATLADGEVSRTETSGAGSVDRDTSWVELDASYLLNERLSLTGGFWRDDLDQRGDYTFGDAVNQGAWTMGTTGVEGGVSYALTAAVDVSGGLRYESRGVDWALDDAGQLGRSRDTSHTGVFVAGVWRPRPRLSLDAELETGKYNDPFTLASPTDRLRFRAQGRLTSPRGPYATVSMLVHRLANDDRQPDGITPSDWQSDRDHLNLRAGFRRDGLDASAGYAFVRVQHDVEQTINASGSPFPIPVLYEADSNFVDGRVRWQVAPRWRVGGDLRFYDNGGTYALRRQDARGEVGAAVWQDYWVTMAYRRIDFTEKQFGFNDYDAHLVEVSLGYAW